MNTGTVLGIIVSVLIGLLGVLARIPEGQEWLKRTWAHIWQSTRAAVRFVTGLLVRIIQIVKRFLKSPEAEILFLLALSSWFIYGAIQDPEVLAEPKTSAMALVLAVFMVMFMIACILLHQVHMVRDRLEGRLDALYEVPEIREKLGVRERQLYANVWENWTAFLAALGNKNPIAVDEIRQCVPLEVKGDTLIIGCSNISTQANIEAPIPKSPYVFVKRDAERILRRFFGKPNKLSCVVRPDVEIVKLKFKMYGAPAETTFKEGEIGL